MPRLIDADELRKNWIFGKAEKMVIDEAPTIDARPMVYGEWVYVDPQNAKCSMCRIVQKTNGRDLTRHCNIHKAIYKWCPSCGSFNGGD